MGKNLFSQHKPGYLRTGGFNVVAQDLIKNSHNELRQAEILGSVIRHHPLLTAEVVAVAVFGGALIILTDGGASPFIINLEGGLFSQFAAAFGAAGAVQGGVEAPIIIDEATAAASRLAAERAAAEAEQGAAKGGQDLFGPDHEFGDPSKPEFEQPEPAEPADDPDDADLDFDDDDFDDFDEEEKQEEDFSGTPRDEDFSRTPRHTIISEFFDEDFGNAADDALNMGRTDEVDIIDIPAQQQALDDEFGVGVMNANNPQQMAGVLDENPTFVSRLVRLGRKGFEILNNISTVVGIAIGIKNIIVGAKEVILEKDLGKKMAKLTALTVEAQALQAKLGGIEIQELAQIGTGIGLEIEQLSQIGRGLNFIGQNIGQLDTDNKRNALVLDKDLKTLDKEEVREVDALARIATILDRPQRFPDFMKDLDEFDTVEAKINYIAENYDTFIGLPQIKMNKILDTLNNIQDVINPFVKENIEQERRNFKAGVKNIPHAPPETNGGGGLRFAPGSTPPPPDIGPETLGPEGPVIGRPPRRPLKPRRPGGPGRPRGPREPRGPNRPIGDDFGP